MRKKIQDLDRLERPRERLLRYGPTKLATAELLAILLRTGTKAQNVLGVAESVLKVFPGDALAAADIANLKRVLGVGEVKALEIVAALELGRRALGGLGTVPILSGQGVWERAEEWRGSKKEHFVAFYLNTQNIVLKTEVVSVGTVNASLMHPREVFEPAVRLSAASVLVAHNHPAGSLLPSEEDRAVTHRLAAAGGLLGISLLDHVIVTAKGYYSFKEQGGL